MDDLIIDKLKEIKQLRSNIKLGDLEHGTEKRILYRKKKNYSLSKYALPIAILGDIQAEDLPLDDPDNEQSNLVYELGMDKGMNKGKVSFEKRYFLAT